MLRRPLFVAAALALLVGVGVPGSGAASPARNGRIAFEHIGESSGGGAIYSMTARGTKRRLLTPGRTASSGSPSYSPDGRRVVFVSGYKRSELWTMRADGSHKRRLTQTRGIKESDPGWSPDGKEVVFAVERPASRAGIWVIGLDGRHRRRLTTGADANPSWSPDGTEIAFDRFDASTQIFRIFVVAADGGTPASLSNDPGISDRQPDWSPDGSRILFSSDRPDTFRLDLYVMNADGSDVRQVTNTQDLDEHDPVWSPGGRWIAYTGEGKGGASSYQLYMSRSNGSSRRIVTHSCGDCAIINDEPSWQPLRS